MNVTRLPPRKQRATLNQAIGGVLKAGMTGWVMPNKEAVHTIGISNVPDYLFSPDINTELSFLVYAHEVDILPSSKVNPSFRNKY